MELSAIKVEVDRLATKINAPDNLFPTYGYSRDGARPHIEVERDVLYYIVIERGEELRKDMTLTLDQLLYWIFENVTFLMSTEYVLTHRDEGKDSRRIMFAQQEKLLGELNEAWEKTKVQDHKKILEKYPFDDLVILRVRYIVGLRAKGYVEHDINKLAYEKYPLPVK